MHSKAQFDIFPVTKDALRPFPHVGIREKEATNHVVQLMGSRTFSPPVKFVEYKFLKLEGWSLAPVVEKF